MQESITDFIFQTTKPNLREVTSLDRGGREGSGTHKSVYNQGLNTYHSHQIYVWLLFLPLRRIRSPHTFTQNQGCVRPVTIGPPGTSPTLPTALQGEQLPSHCALVSKMFSKCYDLYMLFSLLHIPSSQSLLFKTLITKHSKCSPIVPSSMKPSLEFPRDCYSFLPLCPSLYCDPILTTGDRAARGIMS